jgi:lysophospholipase L1-like esterase
VPGLLQGLFFTSGYKNITVLNPGIEVPSEDETRLQLWGPDPVHALPEGYDRIADLLLKEWDTTREKKRKRTLD